MQINFTEDQMVELMGMITASKIRMLGWIADAKKKGSEKEANHISAMLEKRKQFEKNILENIKATLENGGG